METYRLEMNKEEFLGMLSNYFTSKLGKQIKVKGEHKITQNIRGEDEVQVHIYYEETIQILGHIATKKTVLTKDEIKGILNELINNEDYCVDSVYYNTPSVWKGYGLAEHQEVTFNGVTIQAKAKENQLRRRLI